MTDYAYKDRDGQIVLVHDGIETTLASENGDTIGHRQLAAFLEDGGHIADEPPALSIESARAEKITALRSHCAAVIVSGYQSAALGANHLYPSGIVDQINMLGSVTASLLPGIAPDWSTPFWCRAADGSWAMRPHNAGEVQQAGRDGKAHVIACQTILDTLITSVNTASTVEAVAAVTWP